MNLIIGATGTIGRELVSLLLAGGEPVTAVTRDPAAAGLPPAARVLPGDPGRPASLAAALPATLSAVFLTPRAAGTAIPALLSLAAARGARRVVLVSALTVAFGGGERRFAGEYAAAEAAAAASGLPWTFLRCADFAANALAWAPQIRSAGVVRGAYAGAATSPVHERDVAAVAAAALTGPGHAGQAYVLTGPESLTQAAKVRILGTALGRDLTFQELPAEQVRQGMLAQGLPPEIPDRLLGYLADCVRQPGPTTGTVSRLLGRPALTFAAWAAEHAAAFTAAA